MFIKNFVKRCRFYFICNVSTARFVVGLCARSWFGLVGMSLGEVADIEERFGEKDRHRTIAVTRTCHRISWRGRRSAG